MKLKEAEFGMTFVDDPLSIWRHFLRDFAVARQHCSGDRVQPVLAIDHQSIEDCTAGSVVYRRATPT